MSPAPPADGSLVVLGVDPGLRATGWGVLAAAGVDEGLVGGPSLSARGSTRLPDGQAGSSRAEPHSHSIPLTLSLSKGLSLTKGLSLPALSPRRLASSAKGGSAFGGGESTAEGSKGGAGREELRVLGYGAVVTEARASLPERLRCLSLGLREVIERWHPAEVAVEEAFVAANKRVAIAVGEARGVALLAAAEAGLPVFEYSASEVKQAVAGYGRGSKEQVQEMLRLQLGLEAAPQPADAADALATAFCHLVRRRAEARLRRAKPLSGRRV
jgi:crossover junction endodeoxyribonuclease RuvC